MVFQNKKLVITIFCLLALYITWGMVYLSIKFALESFPPVMLSGMRYTLAGVIMLSYVFIFTRDFKLPTFSEFKKLTLSTLGIIVVSGSFLNMSEEYISSGAVALISGSTPIWMVIAGYMAGFDKKPSLMVNLGLIGGFIGVIFLSVSIGFGGAESFTGLIYITISLAGWVFGSLYARGNQTNMPIFKSLGYQMLIGGLIMLVLAFIIGEYQLFKISEVTPKAFFSYLHLVFFGSLIGFSCYLWLLYNTPTNISVSYAYAEPVVAVTLGAMFAGETIDELTILACLFIIVSVFFVMKGKTS